MKRTKIFAAFAVISAIMATIIVSSCSSEYTEEETNKGSMSKKEKIEKLAEEYGLHLEICDDISTTRVGDETDIEDELSMMASLLGEYEIQGELCGDSIIMCALSSNLFSAAATITSSETEGNVDLTTTQRETIHGTNGMDIELCFEIKISLKWNFIIHNTANIAGVAINELYSGSIISPTVSNSSITVSGGTPMITFSCDLGLAGILGNYYYRVSGDYCPATQIGSLQII